MANYTKAFPGAPTSGFYEFGDTVTDNLNVVWQCVAAGLPGAWVASQPYVEVDATVAAAGTVTPATVSATEFVNGPVRQLRLTMTATPVDLVEADSYGSTLLYTMPEGRIYVVGAVATLAILTTDLRSSNINDNSTIDWAVGTAAASNVALTSTMVDLVAMENEKAFHATSITAYSTTTSSVLAAPAVFDGTTTPIPVYLNFGFSDVADIDADTTIYCNGVISISYVLLGDY